MYLKNTSDSCIVIINTLVGKVPIKPGEIINVKHKILPIVSKNVIQVKEEDYLSFCQGKQQDKEQAVDDSRSLDNEVKTEAPKMELDENTEDTIKDKTVDNFLDKILNFGIKEENEEETLKETIDFESKGETVKSEALNADVEIDSKNELDVLKEEIDKLKEEWKNTTNAHDKDKLSKQIKETQKQYKRLEKLIK